MPTPHPDAPDTLVRLLNPAFLAKLIEAARHYGWFGDHVEVRQFVQWCYETAGLPIPTRQELEPYKD